jgi:hypothetical protein
LEEVYPDAQKVVLMMDNLNAHGTAFACTRNLSQRRLVI